jgi:hypothetical protein
VLHLGRAVGLRTVRELIRIHRYEPEQNRYSVEGLISPNAKVNPTSYANQDEDSSLGVVNAVSGVPVEMPTDGAQYAGCNVAHGNASDRTHLAE